MYKSFIIAGAVWLAFPLVSFAQGQHLGEADKIQATVTFLSPAGQTTTNASGITYNWGWGSDFETKIYPSNYWGTYPLYFVGTTMKFSVTLTNTAAKGSKKFKIRIKADNNVLETNGSAGPMLAPSQEWIVASLAPGETATLPGSIFIAPDPNLPSGLDLTTISIFHLNEGDNTNAGLIKKEIAVWCPPHAR
jgi:hypothetical protein